MKTQTTLATLNTKLLAMTENAKKVKDNRATLVNEIITLVITEAKSQHVHFANKRLAQKWIIASLLEDEKINGDTFTKRALTLAKKLLVDGYIIRKEILSLSQAENVCQNSKKEVNVLMDIDVSEDTEEYTEAVKGLIEAGKKARANKKIRDTKLTDKYEAFLALNLTPAEVALFSRAQ